MSADEPQRVSPSTKRRDAIRKLGVAAAILVIVAIALFGWAMFWPAEPCAHPSCARARFALALEVDAFEQVTPIDFEVMTDAGAQSLQSILSGGGIDVELDLDELHLPYRTASGALDRADLYQFVSAWRNRPAPPNTDARLYALFTAGLVSDKGEPLFGIMFDLADREGFAIAPGTTARFFEAHEPQSIPTLQLRTFIHELLHALNRHHADAAQMTDGRLTLEAPTRCIAVSQRREWSLREAPLLALSPATIRFFQTAASRDVLPGKQNSPFENRRSSPTECEDARANVAVARVESRWEIFARRVRDVFSIRTAFAAEDDLENIEAETVTPPPLEIKVQVQPAAYPLGYPVAARLIVRNTSDEALPVKGRLNPGYGMIQIEHRRASDDEWQILQPSSWFEPTTDANAMLAPGEQTDETIPIYFGDDGWLFATPGDYEIRARLQTGEAAHDAVSDVQSVRVERPRTDDDQAALQPLLDKDGNLDVDIGRLLSFGGRIGRTADITPVEMAADLYGHTAIGSALRLTLLSQRLRRPIDPRTGERPAPDFDDAKELLENTCTDSGVAALTFDLLNQRAESFPSGLGDSTVSPAAAWDGANVRGQSVATYADSSLSAWGPSLHFCFNEAQPRQRVSAALPGLARRLARERPERVVIVGHGDQLGTCRVNDKLALRRAQSIRTALIEAGVSGRRIEVVSLGERRPVDFAASQAAQELNRRVEILIERTGEAAQEPVSRVMPQCPSR